MYSFVDRPVTTLDRGCRFLIWSMRSWTLIAAEQKCPAPVLAPAFAPWRMIGGLQPFLRFMLVLNRDALEKICFCSLSCNHISEHEAILLSLFVNYADGEITRTRDTISLLVDEDSVGDALGAISDIAREMARAEIEPCQPHTVR